MLRRTSPRVRGAPFGTLSVTSISERKMLSLLDVSDGAANGGAAKEGVADMQKRTHARLCRVYPRATRVASSNMDPLPFWRCGAQLVALNMQTNDLAVQLHRATIHTSSTRREVPGSCA